MELIKLKLFVTRKSNKLQLLLPMNKIKYLYEKKEECWFSYLSHQAYRIVITICTQRRLPAPISDIKHINVYVLIFNTCECEHWVYENVFIISKYYCWTCLSYVIVPINFQLLISHTHILSHFQRSHFDESNELRSILFGSSGGLYRLIFCKR